MQGNERVIKKLNDLLAARKGVRSCFLIRLMEKNRIREKSKSKTCPRITTGLLTV
jgi:hypothetical protein